ncbi:MAG: FG-GAP-like repeat-containing protein [Sedimentisphaeraceae bacterium JB056]
MKKRMVVIFLCAVSVVNAALFDDQTPAIGVMTSSGVGYWYQMDSNGNTTASTQYAYGGNAGVAVGDIDSDGRVDFFRGGGSGNTTWYEAKGDPDYGFASVATGVPSGGAVNNGLSIRDFDGDGISDVFRVTNTNTLGWYESNGTNNGLSWRQNWTGVNAVATGDFDGDSFGDLFIIGSTQITWREGRSDNVANWVSNISYSGVKDMVIGNYDGDSNADMFIVRADGSVDWREANGDNVFGSTVTLFGEGISCVELADIDGDGFGELFTGRTEGGLLMYSSGADNVIGDLTALDFGNSATDLAIYNPVPEPTTLALFGMGFSLMASRRRKK